MAVAPPGASKNNSQKSHHFLSFFEASWAPCGHLFGHPGVISGALRRSRNQKIEYNGCRNENQQEPAATTPRVYRKRARTCREPAEVLPKTSKNPPRTSCTNSEQKQFPMRVSVKDFLLRQTLQQKRLEQKWGGGAPPFGDFN